MDILDRNVLVLNKSWMPISVTTVADAITSIFVDKSTIVDHETYVTYTWDDWVERGVRTDRLYVPGSAGLKFEVPEVIILSTYNKVPRRAVSYSKISIFKRDHFCCAYCGIGVDRKHITIDHIVPRSQNGKTTWTNCVASCRKCNERKADRTPQQAGMKLRVTPIKPKWLEYRRIKELAIDRPQWQPFVKT